MLEIPSLESLNIGAALPAIIVAAWACILLLVDLLVPRSRKIITAGLAAAGLAVAFVANLLVYNQTGDSFMGMYVADQFTGFLNLVVLATAFITVLLSIDYLKRVEIERGEYYILLLLVTAGVMFMVAANDLIMIFVALELLSIPLYVMAAFRAPEIRSEEAGLKYFLLGAFASAFFVFGATMVYGATGTTNLNEIYAAVGAVAAANDSLQYFLVLGAGLLIVGMGFKVAAVPFHEWTPDVYEGAPTPVTAFMSVAAKIGGFGALLRILIVGMSSLTFVQGDPALWQNIIAIVAALTVIVGNIVAVAQNNIKRLLAYSSIANAGYVMMALAAAGTPGVENQATRAALIYLVAYMFTNLGAFAVAIGVERVNGGSDLEDFVGLGKSRPAMAIMMAIFMLSLTGVPLTSGFIGKAFVFSATLNAGLVWLAIIGVITSVISAYYYVRVIVNMYLRDAETEPADPAPGYMPSVQWATAIAFGGTLLIGILPVLIIGLTDHVALVAAIAP
ncbi:MAG: NADH-quinone oxidoreductase subunit N [Chloroflexi bacterium OLB15]|nr:MAG: NADH-quinone oxidoreductase subunit N [Chloroflexi bacterium OLB15]